MVELKFPEVLVLSDFGSLVLLQTCSFWSEKQLGENDTCFPGLRKVLILNLNSAR